MSVSVFPLVLLYVKCDGDEHRGEAQMKQRNKEMLAMILLYIKCAGRRKSMQETKTERLVCKIK